MKDDLRRALNRQINRELEASYLYLAMANYFEREGLDGFAGWMEAQSDEERDHARRLLDHLRDRGARVELEAIDEPRQDFDSPLAAIRAALEHERAVTGHIDDLYEQARELGDHPAEIMLQWFVDEQVEEEKTFGDLVEKLELAGDAGSSLLMMDARLGERA